jgi:metal-dependent hydrolase (beta-lactamase superfamily II)
MIISHLHVDHAGGLENFIGTDSPIFVHDKELAPACCSVATKGDWAIYIAHYLKLSIELNCKRFLFRAKRLPTSVVLHLAVSHTPGTLMKEPNLEESRLWLFTSDF